MTQPTAAYLGRITPFHAGRPKFVATVGLSVDPTARMQALLAALPSDFDLDFAIGLQLDAVGVRIGRSRSVAHPLQGLFFSFDDAVRGYDRGIWKGPYDTGLGIYRLDDDTYRRLLRSKALANTWDGTLTGMEAVYAAYFTSPATLVFVSDDAVSAQPQTFFSFDDPHRGFDLATWAPPGLVSATPSVPSVDMVATVGIAGQVPSLIDLALLDGGLVGVKPEGVTTHVSVTSVNGAALFGFDLQTDHVSGFDGGAWGVPPSYLDSHLPL